MDAPNCSCAFLNINMENALLSIALARYEKTLKRVFSYLSPWFDFFTASDGAQLFAGSSARKSQPQQMQSTATADTVARHTGHSFSSKGAALATAGAAFA